MKRLNVALALVLAVIFGLYSCQNIDNQRNTTEQDDVNTVIAVISVNDMHSAIDLMPEFAALVDSVRQLYPDLLVFSAGDNRTGNPINDQYDPVNGPMIALMNKVGFNLCAIGNHEWDGGIEALQRNIEDADFPFLCANVVVPETVHLDVKPYEILHVHGLDIAVVGLVETRASGIPGAHPMHFTDISFRKGIDVLPEYAFLRDQADILILLSHLGYEEDLEVASRFQYYDAILGGHTHTLIEQPVKQHGVMVTQAGSSLRYATLTLFMVRHGVLTDVKSTTLDVEHFGKKNTEVEAMVEEYNSDERFNEALTRATRDFSNREELGCMITDAIRSVSHADFAFNNTGGIRINSLPKGPITIKDVYNIDPFNNEIVVYRMTGAQLENFIMESYRRNGRYPSYVSGMTYTVRTDGDHNPLSVEIRPDRGRYSATATYKVAMNSYMASTVRFESLDEGESQYMTSEEMTIRYLKGERTVSYHGVRRAFH